MQHRAPHRLQFPVVAAAAASHNLPAATTRLIGREDAIAEIAALLANDPDGPRLVTLTGTGGSGKTRLALAVAAICAATDFYPDGVWLVELAALVDSALIASAIMAVLGVHEEPGQSPSATLTAAVRSRHLLLVLDNCEHLIDACATLVSSLLVACPDIAILATSREAMQVPGEVAWRVPSLTVPGPEQAADPTRLIESAAAALFVERARARQPAFAPSAENAGAIAAICRGLDGMPLAIELAAARVPTLTVQQIAARLDGALALLSGSGRGVPERQRTLRAALEWSHALLTAEEQRLLRRVAVFIGGCTLAAVAAVAGEDDETVLGALTGLVEKSLLEVEEGEGEARYQLLEPVRQYAAEFLAASDEGDAIRERHAAYFLASAEETVPMLWGPEQPALLDRLEREHGNLRAALAWFTGRGDVERGLRLVVALAEGTSLWNIRGHRTEREQRLAEILALAERTPGPTPSALPQALYMSATDMTDPDAARVQLEQARQAAIARDDRRSLADIAVARARLAMERGDVGTGRALMEEGLSIFRALGDRRGEARVLVVLSAELYSSGDLVAARSYAEQGLAINRSLDHPQRIARSLHYLGLIAAADGDRTAARALFAESLSFARAHGDRSLLPLVLEGIAALIARDDPARAARLGEASAMLRTAPGWTPRSVEWRRAIPHPSNVVSAPQGSQAAAVAPVGGHALSLDEAIAEAEAVIVQTAAPKGSGGPEAAEPTPPAYPAELSGREVEVLRLVAAGRTNRNIADTLFLSEHTVRHHIAHILAKTGCANRAEATAFALRHALA